MVDRSKTGTSGLNGGARRADSSRRRSRNDRTPSRRSVQLPPRRALIGGALVALAAMGVFAAHRSATSPVETRYVVAAREVPAGTALTRADLATVALDLPDDMNVIEGERADQMLGRVTTTSLTKLELVTESDLFAKGRFARSDSVEVALDLPGARALAGLAAPGSLVDVLATSDDEGGTVVLAKGVRVSSVDESKSRAIGSSGAIRVVLEVDGTDAARAVVDASLHADLTLVLPRPVPEGDR